MRQYLELLQHILDHGNDRGSRAGGTRSVFGYQLRHNLRDGFPLLTTKKLPFRVIVVELLWFLQGRTDLRYLLEHDVHIWSADAYRVYKQKSASLEYPTLEQFEGGIMDNPDFEDRWGDLGPIYGKQWRNFNGDGVDQLKEVIDGIRKNPEGRRHIVTAWNPPKINSMALPPCHCMFQFYVHDGRLSCHMYQRSADVFLGVPFNIASYALLTHIIAHQTDLGVADLIISFGDVHIYNNHRDQVAEQLSRTPGPLPRLFIDPVVNDVGSYKPEDFHLSNYNAAPSIKAPLSVG